MRMEEIMIEKYKNYKFSEVINILRNMYLRDGDRAFNSLSSWCLYSGLEEINLNTICYIDDYPDIDDDTDEETYPEYVIENELDFKYRDELLEDVVSSALHKKVDVTDEELMKAVNFYHQNDSFLEF